MCSSTPPYLGRTPLSLTPLLAYLPSTSSLPSLACAPYYASLSTQSDLSEPPAGFSPLPTACLLSSLFTQ